MPLRESRCLGQIYDHESSFCLCMLCGCDVVNRLHESKRCSWLSRFRAVYRTPTGVKLSGVGVRRRKQNFGGDLWVPIDEHARAGLKSEKIIGLLHLIRPPYDFEDFYLFHEPCWERLASHFEAGELSLERLYAGLEYMPLPYFCREGFSGLIIPLLEQLMQAARPRPRAKPLYRPASNHTDCFDKLPLELREIIASLLPTRDVLNLRRASRAMNWTFTSMSFWKGRFNINRERGYLAKMLQDLPAEERQMIDWQLLYHCTSNLKCSMDFFAASIQTWERLRWLRDMTVQETPRANPPHFGGRALQHYHDSRYRHTRIANIEVSPSLVEIRVSVIQNVSWHGDHAPPVSDHVPTGLESIYDDGRPAKMVGYSTPGALVVTRRTPTSSLPKRPYECLDYTYPGMVHVHELATPLQGFHVSRLGSARNEIHTICAFGGNRVCDHYCSVIGGSFDPYTNLMHLDEVDEVIVTFDQEKIVDLGIRGRRSRRQVKPNMRPQETCLEIPWDPWAHGAAKDGLNDDEIGNDMAGQEEV